MSDTQKQQDDEHLDLAELADDTTDDSEHRSGDEIYQETRRDAGGVNSIDADIENPDNITVDDANPDAPFSEREEKLRQFWRTRYAGKGKGFDYYRPALKFGYELSYSDEYGDHDWTDIEDDIRGIWTNTNPDNWDELEPLVKHGWNMGHQYQADVDIDNPMLDQGTSQKEAAIDEAEGDSAEDANQPEDENA